MRKTTVGKSIGVLTIVAGLVASSRGDVVVIYDDFNDGTPSTGAVGTVNPGFAKANTAGTLTEADGIIAITSLRNGTSGFVSLNSFNATANAEDGFKVTWVLPSLKERNADANNWGTVNLSVQSAGTGLFGAGNGLSIALAYSSPTVASVSVNAFNAGVSSTLASGSGRALDRVFTLTQTVNTAGWAFNSTELNINLSGTWTEGYGYADLFDADTYVGGFLTVPNLSTKYLQMDSVTVTTIPEPATLGLVIAFSSSLLVVRRIFLV